MKAAAELWGVKAKILDYGPGKRKIRAKGQWNDCFRFWVLLAPGYDLSDFDEFIVERKEMKHA